jgi:hypothetical protein
VPFAFSLLKWHTPLIFEGWNNVFGGPAPEVAVYPERRQRKKWLQFLYKSATIRNAIEKTGACVTG